MSLQIIISFCSMAFEKMIPNFFCVSEGDTGYRNDPKIFDKKEAFMAAMTQDLSW